MYRRFEFEYDVRWLREMYVRHSVRTGVPVNYYELETQQNCAKTLKKKLTSTLKKIKAVTKIIHISCRTCAAVDQRLRDF